MELATEVPSPQWLQTHPNNYLEKLLNKSKEQIKLLKQGGKLNNCKKQQEPPDKEVESETEK